MKNIYLFHPKNQRDHSNESTRRNGSPTWTVAEAQGRPSSLPIVESKPVPLPSSVRRAIKPISSLPLKSDSNAIPRSQPINMKRSDQRNDDVNNVNNAATAPSAINISSISPPAVQFQYGGSPPLGSRKRSISGGSITSESPPVAPYLWQISPTFQQSPPIKQSSIPQQIQQSNFNSNILNTFHIQFIYSFFQRFFSW